MQECGKTHYGIAELPRRHSKLNRTFPRNALELALCGKEKEVVPAAGTIRAKGQG